MESGVRFKHEESMSSLSADVVMVGDGKADAALLGSTGGYCQICLLSKEEAHSVAIITEVSIPYDYYKYKYHYRETSL